MAFDQKTRNLLQRTVSACRRLLDEEFAAQRRSLYAIYDDGTAAPLDTLTHLPDEEQQTARLLRDRLNHLVAGLLAQGKKDADARKEAVGRLTREQAFTVLNRLAALRMAEERDIVLECVRRGLQSDGFELFLQQAGAAFKDRFGAYRAYLSVLFDELAIDLGVLFDRHDAAGLLFPRLDALEAVLAELDGSGLANKSGDTDPASFRSIWTEDETIGWIYQYYNDPDERKKMREESSAPRNSRELAVRNQFFTPRYVVEFLTDNTLGRIWYEMTNGRTTLKEQCRYLVRRPNEIFLHDCSAIFPSVRADLLKNGFTNLPDDPTWDELQAIALSMGDYPYELSRQLGLGECVEFAARKKQEFAASGQYVGGALELFCCLFAEQRDWKWSGWGDHPPPEDLHRAKAIFDAFRRALDEKQDGESQEQLLKKPVFIPPRAIKDPREIRLLDPACGSMHFGLYAFDLFETIYEEAWSHPEVGRRLQADYGVRPREPDHLVPTSISLKIGAPLRCMLSGRTVDKTEAVIALKPHSQGAKERRGKPLLCHRDEAARRRGQLQGITPLEEFSFIEALRDQWFSESDARQFFTESGAFDYELIQPPQPPTPEESFTRFRLDIPRLIIEHNIHGIDIDPRSAQIAALSLWLRAQKAWLRMDVPPADRPRVRRSNIVCAEPMPGEKELLREFVESAFPAGERPTFAFLLETVFDRMTLAGEAGSLLRIEEEIRTVIAEAKRLWKEGPKHEQTTLFPEATAKKGQGEMRLDLSGITDEQFWERAEQRIYDALEAYAEQAENGGGFQRRLFADDAAKGFAFIDLCRKRYDVVVMNPPFGDASLPSKSYIDETYGDTKGDVYKAFVECFHDRLLPSGYLGIISSRTGFFLGQSEDWRTRVVLRLFRPIVLADLGGGVLDAMVEVAAYILRNLSEAEARDLTLSLVPVLMKVELDQQDRFSLPKWQAARDGLKRHQAVAELAHLEAAGFMSRSPGDIVRYTPIWSLVNRVTTPPKPVFPPLVSLKMLVESDKGRSLVEAVHGPSSPLKFISDPKSFAATPGCTFAYWIPDRVRRAFVELEPVQSEPWCVLGGLKTLSDERFIRGWWEVSEAARATKSWAALAKGGAFARYYSSFPLVVNWQSHGEDISWYAYQRRPREGFGGSTRGADSYFRPGITWSRRSQCGLSMRALPRDCIFGDKGPAVFHRDDSRSHLLMLLALTNSAAFSLLVGTRVSFGSYEVGAIQRSVLPKTTSESADKLAEQASRAWAARHTIEVVESVNQSFVLPAFLLTPGSTVADRAAAWAARVRTSEEAVAAIQAEVDDLAFRLYGLDDADRTALTTSPTSEPTDDSEVGENEDEEGITADAPLLIADLLAYILGTAFGRWDIRYATGERPAPELPDPFAPLPVCPPGMLQGDDGLPLSPEAGRRLRTEGRYPLDVAWDGIIVDDPEHPLDIERRVQTTFAVLWADRAHALEHEACEILGVKSLRDYFRKPAGFFADHLKRYSKSRRQAPIYWPLSTASGSYTLWIYYHRLNKDTLYKCLHQFVEPKRKEVEAELERLARLEKAGEIGAKERRQMESLEELRRELGEMQAELEQWAPRWKPNLNDGVLITAALLWKLFRLPKWRRDLEACWKELEKGEYDWAHLAFTLWPDRVREKCRKDRSLAIAHGLEDICEVKAPEPKAKRGRKAKQASPAVRETGELIPEPESSGDQ